MIYENVESTPQKTTIQPYLLRNSSNAIQENYSFL
jgi:hypothetical protein